MTDKKTLRVKYKRLRENLSANSLEEMSLQIANQALKLPIWEKTYYHIFLSISTKKEVDSTYLMHILQGKDKSIVVSKADFSDRKSTRLNSSHVKISYAVFCLKKKKKK